MNDYILREDAAVYNPKPKSERDYQTYNIDDAYETGYEDKIKEILTLPSADVRENVRGKWEWNKREGVYLCPFCKEEMHDAFRRDGSYSMAEFCWHCGADMRVKGEKS